MIRALNKNIIWKILMSLLLLAVAGMLSYRVWEWWQERRAHMARYKAFGIDIPMNYSIHGIDVSKYQDVIDWESVKSMEIEGIKIGFVFIKATEGIGDEDRYFKRNWKRAAAAGLVKGAYHFFLATKSGKSQAQNFIASVDLGAGDLPPVLDVERTFGVSGTRLRARVKEFLNTLEDYYKVRPIIYTNVDFYEQYLKDEFDDYPLWVAHYLQKDGPRITRPWNFWQHSETGRVNGIFSRVDFNVFYGDSTSFRQLLLP